jgi:hypothetical protein
MKYIKFVKKMTIMVMAAAFLLAVAPQDACAQLSKKQGKQLQKELDKQYKKKIAEYEKEGWKLAGSSKTIEVALLTHYQKLGEDPDNNVEFVGEVSNCQSINVCKQSALTNALNRYATLASGNVKGRTESMLRADANMPQVEIDKFIAAYENLVKAEVSGVLTESYSIVKEEPKTKMKQYKTFFIMNEEKAGAARKRALEKSLLETQIAVKEAEEISKFVNEGFSLE